MYYPDDLIQQIRMENDIVSVVSEYVQIKKHGSSHFGLCPFHNENTPSFSVNQDKQFFYCFGCGAGGNVYTFIMQIENYSFLEAVKYLADRAHITLPTPQISDEAKAKIQYKEQMLEINRETAKYFYHQLYSNRGKAALQYLNGRKIEKVFCKKFGLGYSNMTSNDLYQYLKSKEYDVQQMKELGLVTESSKNNEIYDRFWNRLIFPIFDVHNKIIGFGGRVLGDANPKYLNSPESLIYNKRKHLYGLNFARMTKRDQLIIVEGYMDVISLHQAGFDNAVASLGTALTTEQAMLIKRYCSNIVLSYDSDQAGIKATLRAIPILERNGLNVKVLEIPKYKDPDEFIKNEGVEAFETILSNCKSCMEYRIDILKSRYSLEKSDEKIKFIKSVSEILAQNKSKIEQDVYIKQIANENSISEAAIREEMLRIVQNTGIVTTRPQQAISNTPNSRIEKDDGIVKLQKNLTAILINHSYTFKAVKQYIQPSDYLDPLYKKIAEYIYDQYEKGMVIELANIITLFVEIEEQHKVSRLFNENCDFETVSQEEKAITELVKGIKQANLDILSRNNRDISQLERLIEIKRQLQNINISLS